MIRSTSVAVRMQFWQSGSAQKARTKKSVRTRRVFIVAGQEKTPRKMKMAQLKNIREIFT
jgi:hypothetical protein